VLKEVERFTFATTHREVEFLVYWASRPVGAELLKRLGGQVRDPARVLAEGEPGMSSPQRRILRALLGRPASEAREGLGAA
jgi:hypothetical protein